MKQRFQVVGTAGSSAHHPYRIVETLDTIDGPRSRLTDHTFRTLHNALAKCASLEQGARAMHNPPTNFPIDLTKLQPGDEVTVRARVKFVGTSRTKEDAYSLETNDGCPSAFLILGNGILTHTPRALAVGDSVTASHALRRDPGVLLCIDGNQGFVRWSDGSHGIWPLTSMSRT